MALFSKILTASVLALSALNSAQAYSGHGRPSRPKFATCNGIVATNQGQYQVRIDVREGDGVIGSMWSLSPAPGQPGARSFGLHSIFGTSAPGDRGDFPSSLDLENKKSLDLRVYMLDYGSFVNQNSVNLTKDGSTLSARLNFVIDMNNDANGPVLVIDDTIACK